MALGDFHNLAAPRGTGRYIVETRYGDEEYGTKAELRSALADYWNRCGSPDQTVRVTHQPSGTVTIYYDGEVPHIR